MKTFEQILEIIDHNLVLVREKISIIDAAKKNKTVTSIEDSEKLSKYFATAEPEIVSLMLNTKSHSQSREIRSNNGDNYQPFVISDKRSFNILKDIISNKKKDKKPFRFDFAHIEDGHCVGVQVIGDEFETNLFFVDTDKTDLNRLESFKELVGDGSIHCYVNGDIQKTLGCAIFAIQNLNALSNMSLFEKKQISNDISRLDARFLKTTQSLSILSEKQKKTNISKTGKLPKVLEAVIEEHLIYQIVDGTKKIRNKFFDYKLLKYLDKIKDELVALGNKESMRVISKRMEPSEEYNTYISPTYENHTKESILQQINPSFDGFEIGKILRTVSPKDRTELKIEDLLKTKIENIAASNSDNKEEQIKDIIVAFPKNERMRFNDTVVKILDNSTMVNFTTLIESFAPEDRDQFIKYTENYISEKKPGKLNDLLRPYPESIKKDSAMKLFDIFAKNKQVNEMLKVIEFSSNDYREDLAVKSIEFACTKLSDRSQQILFIRDVVKKLPSEKVFDVFKETIPVFIEKGLSDYIGEVLFHCLDEDNHKHNLKIFTIPLLLKENDNYSIRTIMENFSTKSKPPIETINKPDVKYASRESSLVKTSKSPGISC